MSWSQATRGGMYAPLEGPPDPTTWRGQPDQRALAAEHRLLTFTPHKRRLRELENERRAVAGYLHATQGKQHVYPTNLSSDTTNKKLMELDEKIIVELQHLFRKRKSYLHLISEATDHRYSHATIERATAKLEEVIRELMHNLQGIQPKYELEIQHSRAQEAHLAADREHTPLHNSVWGNVMGRLASEYASKLDITHQKLAQLSEELHSMQMP